MLASRRALTGRPPPGKLLGESEKVRRLGELERRFAEAPSIRLMASFLTGFPPYPAAPCGRALFHHCHASLNLRVRATNRVQRIPCRACLLQSRQLHFISPFRNFWNTPELAFMRRIFRDRPPYHLALRDIRDAYAMTSITHSIDFHRVESCHFAASLIAIRNSASTFIFVGSLEVIQLPRRAPISHGLRRYSHVFPRSPLPQRHMTCLRNASIDWNRSDYDPDAAPRHSSSTHIVQRIFFPDAHPPHDFPPAKSVLGDPARRRNHAFQTCSGLRQTPCALSRA